MIFDESAKNNKHFEFNLGQLDFFETKVHCLIISAFYIYFYRLNDYQPIIFWLKLPELKKAMNGLEEISGGYVPLSIQVPIFKPIMSMQGKIKCLFGHFQNLVKVITITTHSTLKNLLFFD